jgi:hypothetical protein
LGFVLQCRSLSFVADPDFFGERAVVGEAIKNIGLWERKEALINLIIK